MLRRDARPPVAAAGTWPLFVAPPGQWLALLIPLVRALAGRSGWDPTRYWRCQAPPQWIEVSTVWSETLVCRGPCLPDTEARPGL